MRVARKTFAPEPILISIPQAAIRLGTTVPAIRNLLWDGQMKYIRLGKRFLIPISELDGWISRNLRKN